MRSFIRNQTLSLRTPEECSLHCVISFNKHNVQKFFDKLHSVLARHERFSDSTRIFNPDGTPTITVQKSATVLTAKNAEQVNKVTSREKGVVVTT